MESPTRERIAHLLKASGRKAKPFSKLCGLGEPHIGMILRGDVQTPDQGTLQKIATTAGCSLLWLMHGEGLPPDDETVRTHVDAREASLTAAHTASDFAVSSDDPRPSQAA